MNEISTAPLAILPPPEISSYTEVTPATEPGDSSSASPQPEASQVIYNITTLPGRPESTPYETIIDAVDPEDTHDRAARHKTNDRSGHGYIPSSSNDARYGTSSFDTEGGYQGDTYAGSLRGNRKRGLGVAALHAFLESRSAGKSETGERRRVVPTQEELLDGITNDLIADVQNPRSLSREQRFGIAVRLGKMVRELTPDSGQEVFQKLGIHIQNTDAVNKDEKAWGDEHKYIAELQREVEGLLGGLPGVGKLSEDMQRQLDKITKFYYYSPLTETETGELPWSPTGTIHGSAGQKRIRERLALAA